MLDHHHKKKFWKTHTIIYLHGITSNKEQLKPLWLKKHNILTIDLPGHGSNKEEHEVPILEFTAKKIKQLIKKKRIKNYSFVGFSLGGYIIQFLLTQGLKPKKIVLIGTAAKPPHTVLFHRYHFITKTKPLFHKHETKLETLIREYRKRTKNPLFFSSKTTDLETVFNYLQELESSDFTHILKDTNIPTLIIHGNKDKLIPKEGAEHLAKNLPKAILEILPAGHNSILKHPLTKKAIETFFS